MTQLEPVADSPEPPWPSPAEMLFGEWERLARYPNSLAAHIVAGLLESEGVPTIVEAGTPFPGAESAAIWIPTKLGHRARWILAWPPSTEAELVFLATGEFIHVSGVPTKVR